MHMDFADYYDEGFIQIQHALHKSVISLLNPNIDISQIDTVMERFPYPPYTDDLFLVILQFNFAFFIMLCFIFFSLNIPKEVTFEKEQKLKVRDIHEPDCRHNTCKVKCSNMH